MTTFMYEELLQKFECIKSGHNDGLEASNKDLLQILTMAVVGNHISKDRYFVNTLFLRDSLRSG